MNRNLRLSLAIALALGSPAAMALGLGGISVKSELNQPLTAEIPVYVSSPAEAETLAVKLASADEFARVGLNIGEISVPITFDVAKNARGEPVIQVSSAEPIREPFVTFLVEVNWANGRLLREYSVLLEPPITSPAATIEPTAPSVPSTAQPAATPITEAPVAEPETIAPETAAEPEPAPVPEPVEPTPAPVETAPEPIAEVPPSETMPVETAPTEPPPVEPAPVEPSPTPSASASSEYGPIAAGETLWEIASTTRPGDAVTINQMMLALLRANPEAFYRDNVNALKRGAVLRIPGSDELVATSVSEAAAEILSQNQTWIASTQTSLVADADSSNRSTSNSSGSRSSAGSRVELVPPASGDRSSSDRQGVSGGTGEAQAVRQELTRTKEELASKSRDNQELDARVKELEQMQDKSQRLITVQNSQIKALQDQLKKAEAARETAEQTARDSATAPVTTTPEPTPTTATEPETITAEPVATDASANGDTATDTSTEAEPITATPADGSDTGTETGTDTSGETEPETTDAGTEPTPVPLPEESADPTPAAAEERPPQPFYMNPMVWGAGALGALLIAGLAIFGLTRRKKAPAAGKSAPAQSSLARSPLSDAFAGGVAGGATAASHSGDPEEGRMLAELSRDPTDLNAHLSLLEHYYTSRNVDKFEAQAEAMYAQIPSTDVPEWQGAVLMGRDLCPSHPLFAEDHHGGSSPDFSSSEHDPFGLPNFDEPPRPSTPTATPQRDQFGFDISPPTPAVAPPKVPATDTFDFNLLDAKHAPVIKEELDFDLDKLTETKPVEVPSLELPNFTLETTRTAPPEATIEMPRMTDDFLGDDAVATKLDLARAYLDMGDSDGAKSMLDEVMTEGNDKQKDEARKLLAEIR
ncbi:hypothetical protein C7S18_14905 [Ahniella affigens]|uniref:FimV N-terminal domain-containing protein n=1 Tax=Ahniella affigens TaxID=2021234 RepID=A0A2P1PU80_9GAMM|nr:FimV/HubP family polar landmark protein [Ahniella affigens]AVP98397.1 hypothetical protein C7S18_14905 [Ahniella affigens]